MDTTNFPQVGYSGLLRIARNSARTRRPLIVIGHPGYGKTALMGKVAREIGRKLVWFDLGNGAREDAMMPTLLPATPGAGPVLVRIPLDALALACAEPVLLFIDEVTRADRNKQAIAMALANERRIGSYTLHPGTVVVMAGNGAESSGTYSLNDALVNRCCVIRLVPDRDEVRGVIGRLADLTREARDEEQALGPVVAPMLEDPTFVEKFKMLCLKYSAIAGQRTELLAMEPPEGASETCAPFPSPRAIHQALERQAASIASGDPVDEITLAEMGGVVGREAAAAWFAVLGNEHKLPTEDEVLRDPKNAKLPPDFESAIAALGLVKLVHQKNANSAWLYVGRFGSVFPEIQSVIARDLLSRPPTDAEALKVFNTVVGKAGLAGSRAR